MTLAQVRTMTAADVEANRRSGRPPNPGTIIIDQSSGEILGIIDKNGNLGGSSVTATSAQVAAAKAAGTPYAAGTTVIDPPTGSVLGVVDGGGWSAQGLSRVGSAASRWGCHAMTPTQAQQAT